MHVFMRPASYNAAKHRMMPRLLTVGMYGRGTCFLPVISSRTNIQMSQVL